MLAPAVLQTVQELLHDRGYSIVAMNNKDHNDICIEAVKDEVEKLYVFDLTNVGDKVVVKTLRNVLERLNADQVLQVLIITTKGITAKALQELRAEKQLHVTIFNETALYRNITKHKMYFPHRRLCAEETQKVLDRYKREIQQFPQIEESDPVVQYYGWLPGSLIEIRRTYGDECQPEIYYRCVVKTREFLRKRKR